MKKVLMALAVLSLPAVALADDSRGFYVQIDAGHAKVKAKYDGGSDSIGGFSPRLSAGYDFGDFRVAADYTHYKDDKSTETYGSSVSHDKVKFRSIGVSAIYDFDTQTPVKPYVGARVALNRVSYNSEDIGSTYTYTDSYRGTKTGIGALAGVSYEITPNIALDAGYRYNHWGKFFEDGDTRLGSHEFSAGVRVKF